MELHDPESQVEHAHRPVSFYIAIYVALCLLTVIEIGPILGWYHLTAIPLLILTAAKFGLVVAFFMHLWDDAGIFTHVFTVPLIGTTLMISVLMLLFHTYDPAPGFDPPAVEERYWGTFQQPCASWLRSHSTNRWFCASPPIEEPRMRRHLAVAQDRFDFRRDAHAPPPEPVADIEDLETEEEWLAYLMEEGERVFATHCAVCHGADGAGVGLSPALAGHDLGTPEEHAETVVGGLAGAQLAMPAFGGTLNNTQTAAVITYERMSWGNDLGMVMPEVVEGVR